MESSTGEHGENLRPYLSLRYPALARRRSPSDSGRTESGAVQTHLSPVPPTALLDAAAYAYLLGLYLGDGHITARGLGSHVSGFASVRRCMARPARLGASRRCRGVMRLDPASSAPHAPELAAPMSRACSKHWPCLLPQHGPGRKHERRIELEPWQQEIVTSYPGDFARGLFHSDGCRLINHIRRPLKDGDRWYEYPRYLFVNRSAGHSPAVRRSAGPARRGLAILEAGRPSSSPARAVARLDEFVGPKY